MAKGGEPVMSYMQDGPAHDFVRELLAVPSDTQLPPGVIITR